jgi:hypothetical protein
MFVDFLELFEVLDMDDSFLVLLQACSQPLSMQQILPKTTQNCPNLPNDETLKYHQKSRFWCFSKIKISTSRRGTRACFRCLDFQSKNFSYAIFIVKNGICM